MDDDPKIDLYLKNRALIEEWAELGTAAQAELQVALLTALTRPLEDQTIPRVENNSVARLFITSDPLPETWIGLAWDKRTLLKGAGGWPNLVVFMDGKHPLALRSAVKNATAHALQQYGLTSSGAGGWLR